MAFSLADILAVNQTGGIALCQPLPSHGATTAVLALWFQSPLQQQQQTQITVFNVQHSVSVPAVITPTSTLHVRFLATQDRTNSTEADTVVCCI